MINVWLRLETSKTLKIKQHAQKRVAFTMVLMQWCIEGIISLDAIDIFYEFR